MKVDKVVVVALILFAVIIVGELCTVDPNVHNYNSSAEWKDGHVEYSVSASGSERYDVLLFDNHGYESTKSIAIYVDNDYEKNYGIASSMLGIAYTDQEKTFNEMNVALQNRGISDIKKCDDSSLKTFLNDTMGQKGKGVLVLSYELPSDIYDGTDNCLLMNWINNGGNLYWLCSEIGAFSKSDQGVTRIESNQMLFYGADNCICRDYCSGNSNTNELTDYLSFNNSMLRFCVDISKVTNTAKFSTGFTSNGYSTVTSVSVGKGAVSVFSESNWVYLYGDVAQVIASGINPYTTLVSHESGTVTRGTVNGKMDVNVENPHLYIYIGGHMTVYGRAYR